MSEGEPMRESERPPESERARRARARCEKLGIPYVDERAETGRRGYQWAPFEKGNLVRMTHGAGVPVGALRAPLELERPPRCRRST
jgi:hypothetical protein